MRFAIPVIMATILLWAPVRAQVTYVDKVPTLEELQRLLTVEGAPGANPATPGAADAAAPRPQRLRRGIESTDGSGLFGGPPATPGATPNVAPNAVPYAAPNAAPATSTSVRASVPATAEAAPATRRGPAVAMPITFELGSARVSSASVAYVDVVAQLLIQNPTLQLTIEGHTDASGNSQRNMLLSWERAVSVYRLLVEKHGIDATRLLPSGRGSLDPLVGLLPSAPANRRVQFRVGV